MALTNQPYIPLYVRDWLTSNKLKMCSPAAHGLMINVMCVMHKEEEYGMLLLKQSLKQSDDMCLNFASYLARLLPFSKEDILPLLQELLEEKVLLLVGNKLICKRMVEDAALSTIRSGNGSKGGRSTQSKNRETAEQVAKAKIEANTANESVNEIATATANVIALKEEYRGDGNSEFEPEDEFVYCEEGEPNF